MCIKLISNDHPPEWLQPGRHGMSRFFKILPITPTSLLNPNIYRASWVVFSTYGIYRYLDVCPLINSICD